MILTGENWNTGRKTLCSVGGRWMNEYGAMVEWYWQGKTEVLREKHYTSWVVDEWMSMEQWWNDTDRGNWNTERKTLYSVGGRWMNEYGAMMEWYWQGKTEVLGKKTCRSATMSFSNPERLGRHSNPVFWHKRPATNRLRHKRFT